MDLDLTGKPALVTGSTRGIGLAAAKGLVAMGANVIVNGRTQATVDHAVAVVRDAAPKATVTAATHDLGTADGCDAMITQVPAVDILINKLGIYEPKQFLKSKMLTGIECSK